MNFEIEFHSGIPVYKQIVNQVAAAVADGTLKTGDQLPTIRALRETLQVNPNTVAKAYRELELNGLISSQRGSGCFVAPPRKPVKLSSKEKNARIRKLLSRITSEARSQDIPIDELMDHIYKRRSHA